MGLLDGISNTLFGDDGSTQSIIDSLNRNKALYNNIQTPSFAQYIPQKYDNETANYQLTSDDPVAKSKQLEAIARVGGLANTGLSDADVAGFQAARGMGDQMARAQTAAAMQDAQARGVGGGGLEFAMREAGNQDADQRAQQAALAQAAQASNNRAGYLQNYASQLGQARQQDYNTNAANTNVVNQFNAMNTQNRNAANQANTAAANNAFQYNQGMQQQNYANQMGKANALAGINTQQGDVYSAQDAANRQRQMGLLGMAGAGLGAYLGSSNKGG